MSTSSQTLDLLNALLDAEQSSLFLSVEEVAPYLARATVAARHVIHQITQDTLRNIDELAGWIDTLGGCGAGRRPNPEEQYLAFLTIAYLLPKLMRELQSTIARYQAALAALPKDSPEALRSVLEAQLAQHESHLKHLAAIK